MVLVLAVSVIFLLPGFKILWISHHRKFQSVGASQNWYPLDPGWYPTKIIFWLFGLSLLLFFKMCTHAWQPKTCKVRCQVLPPWRVQLVFYSQPFLSYMWTLTFTACTQKLLESSVWSCMASDLFTMICWNLSACPFCCGKSGNDIWCTISFSFKYVFCSFERNSPPQSVYLHFNVVLSCLSAQAL